MNIKFVTEDGLEMLRKNSELLFKDVVVSGKKTLVDFLGDAGQIKESSIEVDEFVLDIGQP